MALIKCKKCRQPVSDKADFCSVCGAPVEVAVENNGLGNVSTVTCGECGFECSTTSPFCPECGSSLADTVKTPATGVLPLFGNAIDETTVANENLSAENDGLGTTAICGECGFECSATSPFCPECGSSLVITDVEPAQGVNTEVGANGGNGNPQQVAQHQSEETVSPLGYGVHPVATGPETTVAVVAETNRQGAKETVSDKPKTEVSQKSGNAKFVLLLSLSFVLAFCCVFFLISYFTSSTPEGGAVKTEGQVLDIKKENPVAVVEEVVNSDSLAIVAVLNEVNRMLNDSLYYYELPLSAEYEQLMSRAKSISDSITSASGEAYSDTLSVLSIEWLNQMYFDSVEYEIISYHRAEYDSLNTDVLKRVVLSVEFNDLYYFDNATIVGVHFVSVDGKWFVDNVGSHKEQLTTYIEGNSNNRINGHEYVDLGLPSGTLWATCNIGATTPEEYGEYYAWGEVTTKVNYCGDTYQYNNGGYYMNIGDNIGGTEYDVARTLWGSNWRLPSKAEFQELVARCNCVWTTCNGVAGYKFTASNGNSLFLPAGGYRDRTESHHIEQCGYYWSSTIYENDMECAYRFRIDNSGYTIYDYYREFGNSVRPVYNVCNDYVEYTPDSVE